MAPKDALRTNGKQALDSGPRPRLLFPTSPASQGPTTTPQPLADASNERYTAPNSGRSCVRSRIDAVSVFEKREDEKYPTIRLNDSVRLFWGKSIRSRLKHNDADNIRSGGFLPVASVNDPKVGAKNMSNMAQKLWRDARRRLAPFGEPVTFKADGTYKMLCMVLQADMKKDATTNSFALALIDACTGSGSGSLLSKLYSEAERGTDGEPHNVQLPPFASVATSSFVSGSALACPTMSRSEGGRARPGTSASCEVATRLLHEFWQSALDRRQTIHLLVAMVNGRDQ